MDIKLIAMDLDGTTLQKDRKSFSPRLIAALDRAHERGIHIVPVTGRPLAILPPQLDRWADWVVLCNGAKIMRRSTGETPLHLKMSPEGLEGLIAISLEYDLPLEFFINDVLHVKKAHLDYLFQNKSHTFHVANVLRNIGKPVDDMMDYCHHVVDKANLLAVPTELRGEIDSKLAKLPISAVWSGPHSIETTHPDATKGRALQMLCDILNIPMENVLAMGDSGNDESMLRCAGFGVAMGNAPAEIQACARHVAPPHNEDGAAITIERWVLGDN